MTEEQVIELARSQFTQYDSFRIEPCREGFRLMLQAASLEGLAKMRGSGASYVDCMGETRAATLDELAEKVRKRQWRYHGQVTIQMEGHQWVVSGWDFK
jgi:hypothetical protein